MNTGTSEQLNQSHEDSLSKETFSEDVKNSLKKANEYFDKNPPRASTQEELDEFFKNFK